ncbi:YncE family protein [Dyella sp. EPa41]|uniref:YncE family protein n=1 Tax=Dyella sp. EPa41 TaxID=1561194 RepID=UPI0019165D11|nr:YncE family protein [Dyella sp. EPa41]
MAIAHSLRSLRLSRLVPFALAAACIGGNALAASPVNTVAGMPPVVNPANIYSESGLGHVSPEVAKDLPRIYVPNLRSNDVYVIDPATYKVVDKFKVGEGPQHVVPSWDMRTLWATNNAERKNDGSLTPIDPRTGKPGKPVAVDDPYNMYFTPDGKEAIVVAEAHARLDFRDAHTMAPHSSLSAPECKGINHAEFSIDGRYAIFTCEFTGKLTKIDMVNRKVLGYLDLSKKGMPQDIRVSADGKTFYVADMMADGVYLIDGDSFKQVGFIKTGVGTHGLYPSRDGSKLYVANRGSNKIHGPRHGKGSVSVIDFKTQKVVANWPIPGGGSPDMGNVSADGKTLWLSGRFDDVVYAIDTTSGAVRSIKVGQEPHGLTVWPQPGRYSLGHTGIVR